MSADPFYRSKVWLGVRMQALKRDGWTCTAPQCGRKASHVDHVRSIAAGGGRLDLGNLASLCASCHSRKTARADGGLGRAKKTATFGCDASGTPLDRNHWWRDGGIKSLERGGQTAVGPSRKVSSGSVLSGRRGRG